MAYGAIAAYLADWSGRASPRLVGQIMARHGDGLPWHRVVRGGGLPARGHEPRALRLLRDEGAPLRRGGLRLDMAMAAWAPPDPAPVLLGAQGVSARGADSHRPNRTARRTPSVAPQNGTF